MPQWIFLGLFSVFLSFGADEFDPQKDIISDDYTAGRFLIYNCEELRWVCVTESLFSSCHENRRSDSSKKPSHSCAPIGEFPTKESCFQRQLFMVSQNHGKRFCVRDDWKEKNVE
jgi:hypothetical protein